MDIKSNHYDIIICGGGIAGLSACRHLLLKMPELAGRIAIIEPRSEKRNNLDEDYKVGESTVEVSAMFFAKELGLQDYLIENHPPKFSLQFHWPRDPSKTDTMDDYYSTWAVKNPDIQAFQLNRCKIERDLLKMVVAQGAVYYHGRVRNVDLTKGDEIKTLEVELLTEEEEFKDQKVIERIILTTDYIVDSSGRNFVVGSRTNNILKDPSHLFGLQNASTWVRVKNTDRRLFEFTNQNVTCSWSYDTNHFFGPGYWIWMIPLERSTRDYSIGVSYHRDKIAPSQLNSMDKFMSFLEKNQKILYNVIKSGEIVDFHRWPKLAHTSRTFFSQDNWCVLGDAAAIFDPFYSTGMVMIAMEVECMTEMLKYKLAKDKEGYQLRVNSYDKLIRAVTQVNNHLIKDHSNHLGNASVMSWRIYFESATYFSVLLPAYIGKYHLCPIFVEHFTSDHENNLNIRNEMLKVLDHVNENNINIGFMDNHRGSQLFGKWSPTSSWDHDNALSDCKYGHKRLNLPKCLSWNNFYQSLIILKLYYRAYGISALWNSSFFKTFSSTFYRFSKFYLVSLIHDFNMIGVPKNEFYQKMQDDFKSYKYNNEVIDWKY
ncbi:hypothetical protein DICPUDRAFT_47276 [Dictyostelium purpureum]|uniref:FAD-binding domain-containing protein n=1 Tax=Dictyostelium purpureum TaxID=5786 RepID=F0ZIP4_DICPU|nr:uncharacterized protein DICPUDRAFT_47276 [Dictyostelium purpureum]EGC36155.1 hypothetical protein DICPUDRAFT_47276 [Dictyostelium purpureum]|eukprot:XP_003287288.1 hypothetical protein DICPUDRAFT_47276 [Dictyostelium purpureum]